MEDIEYGEAMLKSQIPLKNFALGWAGLPLILAMVLIACSTEVREFSTSGGGGSGGTGASGGTGMSSGVAGSSMGCAAPEMPGDCAMYICEADGTLIVMEDPNDLPPPDGNECTSPACIGLSPAYPPLPAGTPCTIGGKLCDGLGTCVECVTNAECPMGQVCDQNKCVVSPGPDKLNCGCADGSMITVCADLDCFSGPAQDMICVPLCESAGGLQSTGCLDNNPMCGG